MSFEQAIAAGAISQFKLRLIDRLKKLASETNEKNFFMPVAIILVIDKDNGGDLTAQELVNRFKLLDFESKNVIDFYFLGWTPLDSADLSKGLRFDLDSFESCRSALKNAGISKFGGNADLILVDSYFSSDGLYFLNFKKAIRVDLSAGIAKKEYDSLGEFLQSIIETAEEIGKIKDVVSEQGIVYEISDKLGLAVAKNSILEFIFDTWGKIIGAKKLANLAVRNLGPKIEIKNL